MTNITAKEYNEEINTIARDLALEQLPQYEWDVDKAIENIKGLSVSEVLEEHEWIDTDYAGGVLAVSSNTRYIDAYVSEKQVSDMLVKDGVVGVLELFAKELMYADICDVVDEHVTDVYDMQMDYLSNKP